MSFGHISHLERNYSEKYLIWLQVLWPSSKFLIKCIILGSINTPTGTKFIWCSYRSLVVTLASEVVFLKMPSRNQKKRSLSNERNTSKNEKIFYHKRTRLKPERATRPTLKRRRPLYATPTRPTQKRRRPLYATPTRPTQKRRRPLYATPTRPT